MAFCFCSSERLVRVYVVNAVTATAVVTADAKTTIELSLVVDMIGLKGKGYLFTGKRCALHRCRSVMYQQDIHTWVAFALRSLHLAKAKREKKISFSVSRI